MSTLLLLLALASPLQVTPNGFRSTTEFQPAPPLISGDPPNIVVILADDFGVDLVGAYAEAPAPPCTPNIDALAGQGMLFRNAWANPSCSPTRAALMTGRYGFRTGIGNPMGVTLSLDEFILPEMLEGYESACAGKWHLGNQQGLHPNNSGFTSFAGGISGALSNYMSWPKTTNGLTQTTNTYATTDTADEAIAAMTTMQEPWFLYVSFNAPHTPFHTPPAELCPAPGCRTSFCSDGAGGQAGRGKAMVEAMDTELGRVLAVLDGVDPNAWVIFLGDNGTAGQVSEPPFAASHAKGSVYEGGVNVPFIVRGPGVDVGECGGLISVVDVYATLAEISGGTAATATDSVSLVPYFSNPRLQLRDTVYAESFSPNGQSAPIANHERAVRGERYKLLRIDGEPDEFYDLDADPFEVDNLLPALSTEEQLAFDALEAELVALGVD